MLKRSTTIWFLIKKHKGNLNVVLFQTLKNQLLAKLQVKFQLSPWPEKLIMVLLQLSWSQLEDNLAHSGCRNWALLCWPDDRSASHSSMFLSVWVLLGANVGLRPVLRCSAVFRLCETSLAGTVDANPSRCIGLARSQEPSPAEDLTVREHARAWAPTLSALFGNSWSSADVLLRAPDPLWKVLGLLDMWTSTSCFWCTAWETQVGSDEGTIHLS